MKKLLTKPDERECPDCNGSGVQPAKQPVRLGLRIYTARCKECDGKGRVMVAKGN
jgi:DnaJ-class molecular chaperone